MKFTGKRNVVVTNRDICEYWIVRTGLESAEADRLADELNKLLNGGGANVEGARIIAGTRVEEEGENPGDIGPRDDEECL
jgi:hypothetical protein